MFPCRSDRRGMKRRLSAHNMVGGDNMEYQEIKLKGVTYEVHRVFTGSRPAEELLAEQFAKQLAEKKSL